MVWQTLDLQRLIFEEFFKISPSLLARYPEVTDQLLYLILIPHVVLFMFLLTFGKWIGRGHTVIERLLVITAYIYLIWSGFYGGVFVGLVTAWFMIIIAVAFIVFISGYFFSPYRYYQLSRMAHILGAKLKTPYEREKTLEEINKELNIFLNDEGKRKVAQDRFAEITIDDIKDDVKQHEEVVKKLTELLLKRQKLIDEIKGKYA